MSDQIKRLEAILRGVDLPWQVEALEQSIALWEAAAPDNETCERGHCIAAFHTAPGGLYPDERADISEETLIDLLVAERAAARASASNWGMLRRLSEEWSGKHERLKTAAMRVCSAAKAFPADLQAALDALEAEAKKL